ncbi:hypothetical protein MX099_00745 [Streptococcus uberis]|nr:hypothetical protein [Streptococcus uberis]MCK1256480.1 hypothetical protein [Streptococcus uberis]
MTDLKTIERKYSNLFQKDPYAKNKLLYHDFILQYPDSEMSIARFYQTIAQDDSFFDDYPENEISLALLNDLLTLSRKNTLVLQGANRLILDAKNTIAREKMNLLWISMLMKGSSFCHCQLFSYYSSL